MNRPTRFAATAVLWSLCLELAMAGDHRLVANLEAGKPQTIVTYGTSLTAGGAWVGQMQEALNARWPGLATVINSGAGAMWSKWGVDNLDARVITKKPDTVLIEFAINDAYLDYKTSVSEARQNLTYMILRVLAAKPDTEIILMTMNPPVGIHLERRPNIKHYYEMYREAAKEMKLQLIDHDLNWEPILEKDRTLFDKYVPDGIHPGPEGCRRVITPSILAALGAGGALPPKKELPLAGEVFLVNGRTAFLIPAKAALGTKAKPWVWYAPTLPGLPAKEEQWMFERFTEAGIAVAGIDVGESYGSPAGRKHFSALYAEMTGSRGYAQKPVLLGRSRGGLMTLAWGAENPDKVAGFAGIYPVCNIASYPGVANAAPAYGMSAEGLQARLSEHNPIDRLEGLAKAGVPLFAIHGDVDTLVPIEANSGLLKARYSALGGKMELVVPKGQGHNMWSGFFQCQELVDFVTNHGFRANAGTPRTSAQSSGAGSTRQQPPSDEAAAPPWWPDSVETILARAGTNRQELAVALAKAPEAQRQGLQFLLENMPRYDLKRLRASFLLENLALAYEARQETSWAQSVPVEIFLNDVLPYASLSEPRDNWRKRLHDICHPLVNDCKTAAEAGHALNRKLFGLLKVRYSRQRRAPDQGPIETMETGTATCTGLAILLVDACRSVGVPARIAGTPLWSNHSGNHTWVEIWDGTWHFAGAAEADPKGLDRGWFAGNASRAVKNEPEHAIYASSFKKTGLAFPLAWAWWVDEVNAVDVTDRYAGRAKPATPAGTRLLVDVFDRPKGERVEAKVIVTDPSDPAVKFEGVSRGEGADMNDHLTFELARHHAYVVETRVGEKKQRQTFTTGGSAEDQLVMFLRDAAAAQPLTPNRIQ